MQTEQFKRFISIVLQVSSKASAAPSCQSER